MGGTQLFLACSDGLTKELDNAAITSVILKSYAEDSFEDLAGMLVQAAVAAGGNDNVTVVAVESSWIDETAGGRPAERLPEFLEETVPRD